jgi:dephospho-CoA kinase
VLRVGLTGGIGSGKSTAAARLVERGAVLIDSDRLAREVVAAGTPGLAEVVDAFGESVLDAEGGLDRPALAAVVFGDPAARDRLNRIVHPLVRARSDELVAAAPEDAIVVQDVPLLVEGGMGARFPLVVVVHADVEVRVRRLVEHRGMAESDARARIATQADDTARKAAADVWLDNSGSPEALTESVDGLWDDRLVPFAADLRAGRTAGWRPVLVDPSPDGAGAQWPAQAARLIDRVAAAAGKRGGSVAHVGSTAVPGLPAVDVVDLQLGVNTPSDAAAVHDGLRELGFPACESEAERRFPSARCYASADPGRPAHVIVQATGSPGWRRVLLLTDWLRADAFARASWLQTKQRAAAESGGDRDRYAEVKAAWFDRAVTSAEAWAASSGWAPSLGKAESAGSQ